METSSERRGMGERADGDEVDAGLRDLADGVERDAARGFELRAAADERDRLAGAAAGAMLSSRIESAPASSASRTSSSVSHSTSIGSRCLRAQPVDGRRDAAGEAQVVVLDQDRVVEAEPVVRAAAAADRVLLERAQARRRLARVEDLGAGPVDGVDEAAGERRDAGEASEQIQRRPLAGEQGTRAAPTSASLTGSLDRRRRRGQRLEARRPGRARGRPPPRPRGRRRRPAP